MITAKHIYKQLLRVFAHIYHAQFPWLLHLCCEGHFNSLFAHFIAFGSEFDLFDFEEFRTSGRSTGNASQANTVSGNGYPGVCDLIVKWAEMDILPEKVLTKSAPQIAAA